MPSLASYTIRQIPYGSDFSSDNFNQTFNEIETEINDIIGVVNDTWTQNEVGEVNVSDGYVDFDLEVRIKGDDIKDYINDLAIQYAIAL